MRQAQALYNAYQASRQGRDEARSAAEALFVELLQTAIGVGREKIHVVRGGEALPGKYNINLDVGSEAVAHGGVTGAVPTTLTGPLPAPSLELGPLAFHEDSPAPTYATVHHEMAHVTHSALAISWVERWREAVSGGQTKADFDGWLRNQLGRSKISQLDFDVVREQTAESGGSNNTESLAYLAGFTAAYHLSSLEGDDLRLFKSIIEIGQVWPWANHAVQDAVVARLKAYYADVMDDEHQQRFRQFVDGKDAAIPADAPAKPFYASLARL